MRRVFFLHLYVHIHPTIRFSFFNYIERTSSKIIAQVYHGEFIIHVKIKKSINLRTVIVLLSLYKNSGWGSGFRVDLTGSFNLFPNPLECPAIVSPGP